MHVLTLISELVKPVELELQGVLLEFDTPLAQSSSSLLLRMI